jgi:hypothetical protein
VPAGLAGYKVLPNGDFTYTMTPSGFKEEIQLLAKAAPLPIVFRVEATNLTFRKETAGEISVQDTAGTVVGIIPAPTIIDSSAAGRPEGP